MKHRATWTLAIAAAIATIWIMVPTAPAGISGTDHDFSGESWTDQICIVCHTPHNADTTVSDSPLWNHEVTAATNFQPYDSSTMDATPSSTPLGVSKLCLSCHDGTVAVDSFGGSTGTNFIDSGHSLGEDLSDDHPISFAYADATATDSELQTTPLNSLPLFANNLECATCHDVHDDSNGDFLRVDNTGSALCLSCHIK